MAIAARMCECESCSVSKSAAFDNMHLNMYVCVISNWHAYVHMYVCVCATANAITQTAAGVACASNKASGWRLRRVVLSLWHIF